jgi:hypothetical protein
MCGAQDPDLVLVVNQGGALCTQPAVRMQYTWNPLYPFQSLDNSVASGMGIALKYVTAHGTTLCLTCVAKQCWVAGRATSHMC